MKSLFGIVMGKKYRKTPIKKTAIPVHCKYVSFSDKSNILIRATMTGVVDNSRLIGTAGKTESPINIVPWVTVINKNPSSNICRKWGRDIFLMSSLQFGEKTEKRVKNKNAKKYLIPAKVMGGIFLRPILINTHDEDHSIVTKTA